VFFGNIAFFIFIFQSANLACFLIWFIANFFFVIMVFGFKGSEYHEFPNETGSVYWI